jgi:hypothetical protein
MHNTRSQTGGYILAAAFGAVVGGVVVALATRAIPKVMSGMMQTMMSRMEEAGCDPAEL